ncbi:DNA polymerase theta-like [Branchiostoma floridae]|uniref:DNA-directed DNA polymerase n=1 Tax=Branchiostoma floridae TaxID=7739 RepID=A0A9J7HQU9_BRAFL|nr:DNA polymerase theta-like [Branchiostoma floridae]
MIPPPLEDRLCSIKSVLEMEVDSRSSTKITKVFDLKAQYKALAAGCDITMNGNFQDPKVADWLLDPDAKVKRFDEMVKGQFTPQESDLLQGLRECFGEGSLSMTVQNAGSGQTRAALECVFTFHLMVKLSKLLEEQGLSTAFRNVEMPSLVALARLELNGAGFNPEECETQCQVMKDRLRMLEERAHKLAGHTFALNSTKAVDKVLYEEKKLEINEDPSTNSQPQERLSTSRKGVLEKLKTSHPLHPLPGVILKWKHISNLLNKVTPLQKKNVYNPRLNMDRIYSTCNLHTATGRVAFHDPNLQFIPKEFEIEMPTDTNNEDGPPAAGEETMSKRKVCMRHAFIPFKGGVILAADYSQLEVRIMAHLSKDSKLTQALNSGQDVFKAIASQWKGVAVEHVSDKLRQQAKQLYYGIIYGMGPKTLGEKLGVSKEEGKRRIETFKSSYTGIQRYRQTTVDQCKRNGYVQTMAERRRYLPDINGEDYYKLSQAERQAFNTTIQGSAADLVKKAMVLIDQRLQQEFPDTRRSHRHGESTAAAAGGLEFQIVNVLSADFCFLL